MSTRVKTETPEEYGFKEWSGKIAGREFSFRELSVKENDDIVEASKGPDGNHNGRLYMRLMITKCSVEPKLTLDELAKMPNRLYLRLCDVMNELNSETESDEIEDEENAAKNA